MCSNARINIGSGRNGKPKAYALWLKPNGSRNRLMCVGCVHSSLQNPSSLSRLADGEERGGQDAKTTGAPVAALGAVSSKRHVVAARGSLLVLLWLRYLFLRHSIGAFMPAAMSVKTSSL